MQYTFYPSPLTNYDHWCFYEKAFTSEECEKIKSYFLNPEIAKTGEGEVSDLRKSEISWLTYSEETKWVFDKLTQYALAANHGRYHLDLIGFGEAIQIGRYSGGGKYDWHQDFGKGKFSTRKLSIVLQLSKPEEYEGGRLEFFGYDEKVSCEQGDLILFPSFNVHRVTEVTNGERFSLVAWISGPSFR